MRASESEMPGTAWSSRGASLDELHAEVLEMLQDVPEGDPLDDLTSAFVAFAVRASVVSLDMGDALEYASHALELGATIDQLHEVLLLVSGLGAHTLMEGSRALLSLAGSTEAPVREVTEADDALWNRWVREGSYWRRFRGYVPGFLEALLRLSPPAFEGFFEYCALPSLNNTLDKLTREYISIALDMTPNHRYGPGMRVHVANAIILGAGADAIQGTLAIARDAPEHCGTY